MTAKEIANYIDYTQLKAYASWTNIRQLCEEAVAAQTASVCIPPSYVKRVRESYGNKVNICTVIGFPLGYQVTAVKEAETRQAVLDGASEIDMVINIGDVKNKEFEKVTAEIRTIKAAAQGCMLKVIVETCYLTEEEKTALCQCVTRAGADFIKTSTGFGTGGAAIEDILLFKKSIGSQVKIKAAGGIRTAQAMEEFLAAGCSRIGSSSLPREEESAKEMGAALDAEMVKRLISQAFQARGNAYCPYSGFAVGAALLTKGGQVYTGCNIENAAYSPSNCAERTAFFKAVSEGVREFAAIAIVGGKQQAQAGEVEFCAPCGVCRQVMLEFCKEDFPVILARDIDDYQIYPLGQLAPLGFSAENLS